LPTVFSIKHLVVRLFNAFGLDVRRRRPLTPARSSMTGALAQLARLGFKPQTLIDVGAAYQTSEFYEAFRNSTILLIEPLVEFEPFLRKICASYNAQYILAAAGETRGTAVLNVRADKVGSSRLNEVEGAAVDSSPRTVPVITIDEVCLERNLRGPFLFKVDVQGAELQVLAGAKRTLQETEAVILEVSLFGFWIGGPQFYDIIAGMKQYGFVAYDFCGFLYRPLDNALCQVDMVFARENGLLRHSHVFAAPEQMEVQLREMQAQFAAMEKKSS
jgi:FkbM family methyltransferase